MSGSRWAGTAIGAAVLVVGLIAFSHAASKLQTEPSTSSAPQRTPATTSSIVTTGPVAVQLEQAGLATSDNGQTRIDAAAVTRMLDAIPVAGAGPMTGYSRAAYGPAWPELADHCDARNEALQRDLADVTFKPGSSCIVLTGTLVDAYTGTTIHFTRGEKTSADVQVDHLVPIGWAWQHGAVAWTAAKREQLANDLSELEAVGGSGNESKGDQGPAGWLPLSTSYRCTYAARFTYITRSYGLTIDEPDKTAIQQVLATCQ